MKRILSVILFLAMVISLAPALPASAEDTYTVNFFTPTGIEAPEQYTVPSGTSISLPMNISAPAGYSFVGWYEEYLQNEVNFADESILLTDSYLPNSDITLFACYKHSEIIPGYYEKTTVAPTADGNQYLLVYESADKNLALDGAKATTQTKLNEAKNYINVSIDNDQIALSSEVEAAAFTIRRKTTGQFLIVAPSNNYCGFNGASTTQIKVDSAEVINFIDFDALGLVIITDEHNTSGRVLSYSTRYDKFAFYKDGTNLVLYQKVSPCMVWYYTTNPPACSHPNTSLTGAVAATCTTDGYTGDVICDDCGATVTAGTVIPATGHNYVDGVCTVCGAKALLVADSIAAGDQIVLVAEYDGKYYAMENDTSINNALGATEVTVVNGAVNIGNADVVWEVVAGDTEGAYKLKNKDGKFIVWHSGTSIKLADAGVDFTIICGEGTSSVLVTSTRGLIFRNNEGALQYRAYSYNINNNITYQFSTALTIFSNSYEHDLNFTDNGDGTHTAVCTTCNYSKTEAHNYENGVCACGAVDTAVVGLVIDTASLTLYEDIVVNFTATVPEGMTDPYMVVELGEQSYTLVPSREDAQGRLVFEFMNFTPDMMGDNIKATLYATAPGGQLVHFCKPEYSVNQYCTNVMAAYPDDAKLQTLLSDILVYGAATQRFTGHNADALVTDGLTLDAASAFEDLTSTDFGRTGTQDADIQWTGAGLECGSQMSMYFTLNTTVGEATSVEVTINGRTTVYSYSDMTVVDENDFGATCRVVFRGISASEYGDVVTAVLKNNGEQVGQTLTYSVNSYVYSKQHDTNTANLAQLVRAIYNYGKSAKNYLN